MLPLLLSASVTIINLSAAVPVPSPQPWNAPNDLLNVRVPRGLRSPGLRRRPTKTAMTLRRLFGCDAGGATHQDDDVYASLSTQDNVHIMDDFMGCDSLANEDGDRMIDRDCIPDVDDSDMEVEKDWIGSADLASCDLLGDCGHEAPPVPDGDWSWVEEILPPGAEIPEPIPSGLSVARVSAGTSASIMRTAAQQAILHRKNNRNSVAVKPTRMIEDHGMADPVWIDFESIRTRDQLMDIGAKVNPEGKLIVQINGKVYDLRRPETFRDALERDPMECLVLDVSLFQVSRRRRQSSCKATWGKTSSPHLRCMDGCFERDLLGFVDFLGKTCRSVQYSKWCMASKPCRRVGPFVTNQDATSVANQTIDDDDHEA